MELEFTEEASNDLAFIRQFLIDAGVPNSQTIVEDIASAAGYLLVFPRSGVRVVASENPDLVRDYYHKNYVLRYLITPGRIYILRVWHQKENQRNL